MSKRNTSPSLRRLTSLVVLAMVNGACLSQVTAPSLETFGGDQITLPTGWKVVAGVWTVRDGSLVADAMNSEAYITFGNAAFQN